MNKIAMKPIELLKGQKHFFDLAMRITHNEGKTISEIFTKEETEMIVYILKNLSEEIGVVADRIGEEEAAKEIRLGDTIELRIALDAVIEGKSLFGNNEKNPKKTENNGVHTVSEPETENAVTQKDANENMSQHNEEGIEENSEEYREVDEALGEPLGTLDQSLGPIEDMFSGEEDIEEQEKSGLGDIDLDDFDFKNV